MKGIIVKDKQCIFESFETPEISSSQCLVKIYYAGVNRADLLQKQGLYPPPPGESSILGLEFSGEVMEVGDLVSNFKIGDHVCGIVASGGYAEYINIEASHLLKVPDNLNLEAGAAIPEAFITAYQALVFISNIKAKERVLIHAGASGVGAAAIQLAKSIGAYVICTASGGKHDFCYQLGADECIDYKKVEFDKATSEINMVLDLIGGSYFQKNLQVLAPDGRMVMLGFLGGVNVDAVNIVGIVSKRLNIQGSTLRARSKSYKANLIGRMKQDVMMEDHFPFEANVDKVFDWEKVEEAHLFMKENQNKGKILLKVVD